jgi:hypothetical protein
VAKSNGLVSIANYFLFDFNKGIKNSSKHKLMRKVILIVNFIKLIKAISNDIVYK